MERPVKFLAIIEREFPGRHPRWIYQTTIEDDDLVDLRSRATAWIRSQHATFVGKRTRCRIRVFCEVPAREITIDPPSDNAVTCNNGAIT